jgi:hypothetical protein
MLASVPRYPQSNQSSAQSHKFKENKNMKSMKSIMSAGLCLVAMLVVGMVAAGTASAAPVWEHCETEKINTTVSKWTTDQCTTASSMAAAGFSWQEVKGTEAVRSHGSLRLSDETLGVKVEVLCSGANTGSVGPGKFDRIEKITEIQCVEGKNCEKLDKTAEPRNLPWQTELVEPKAGEVRDHITNGGNGEPGWAVTCTVPVLGEREDVCTTEKGTTVLKNTVTKGVAGELLVLADFEKPVEEEKANCTVGGTKKGEVLGSIAILQASGQALRIS